LAFYSLEGRKTRLRTRLFLLALPQGQERDARDLDNLEANTGNITNLHNCVNKRGLFKRKTYSVALATKTGNENFVVFFDIVQAAVILRVISTALHNRHGV
jgi:hypothetical protein